MIGLNYLNIENSKVYSYGRWIIDESFKPGKSLAIGFSRKNGHAFLVAGKYEIHGHFVFKKIWLRLFTPRSCRPLAYVHFPNISESEINKLEAYLEKKNGTRDFTCIRFITRSLEEALGIKMNKPLHELYSLEDHLGSMVNFGFSQNGAPIRTKLNVTEDWGISKIMKHLIKLDDRFTWLGVLSWFCFYPLWPLRQILKLQSLNPIRRLRNEKNYAPQAEALNLKPLPL